MSRGLGDGLGDWLGLEVSDLGGQVLHGFGEEGHQGGVVDVEQVSAVAVVRVRGHGVDCLGCFT